MQIASPSRVRPRRSARHGSPGGFPDVVWIRMNRGRRRDHQRVDGMAVRGIFAGIIVQKTGHFPHKTSMMCTSTFCCKSTSDFDQICAHFNVICHDLASAPALPPLHRARSAAATVLVVVVHPLVCGFSGRVITQFERIQQHDGGRCCCHQQKAGTWR